MSMGKYRLCQNIVMPDVHPVHKHVENNVYLYFQSKLGDWLVGPVAGSKGYCYLQQMSKHSPSPNKTISWEYGNGMRM